MILRSDAALRELLARSRTIALIGASPNPERPSNEVFHALRAHSKFDVSPINPQVAAVDGVTAYRSLTAYARVHGAPDIVDVFRKASEAEGVAREAIAVRANAIWFQFGVINQQAIALAHDAGLDVVVDRCLKIEVARLAAPR